MRPFLVVALLLATLFSLTNTVAIKQSAAVQNGVGVSVATTDTAALALTPGTGAGNAAGTAQYRSTTSNDRLMFQFDLGPGKTPWGFPPAETGYANVFEFRSLFWVKNNSQDNQCISVYLPGGVVPELQAITVGGSQTAGTGGAKGTQCYSLAKGGSVAVTVTWSVGASSPVSSKGFTLLVESVRQ